LKPRRPGPPKMYSTSTTNRVVVPVSSVRDIVRLIYR
jgi:hypothetical protein